MAEIVSGKTINQLIQIEDITGNEIIPLSMKNKETGKYVTRSITLNNMLKLIVNAIQSTNNRLSEAESNLDEKILNKTSELNSYINSKIDETNTKFLELSHNISDLASYTSYLSSYTNAAFAKNDEIDKKQQEEISTNNQLNSYQQINIEKLTDVQTNPWEIAN